MSRLCVAFESIAEESSYSGKTNSDHERTKQQHNRHDNASNHVVDGSHCELIVATLGNKRTAVTVSSLIFR